MSPGAHNLGNGNQIRDGLEPCRPRYHVEGQTSSVGRCWHIWDGHRLVARFQNIADEGDAVLLCTELNANQSSLDTMGGRIEELAEIVEVVAARKTIRESLIGIVGERYLPQQDASDTDKLILRARAALKGAA